MEGISKLACKPEHSTRGKSEGLLRVCVRPRPAILSPAETWACALTETLEGLPAIVVIIEC